MTQIKERKEAHQVYHKNEICPRMAPLEWHKQQSKSHLQGLRARQLWKRQFSILKLRWSPSSERNPMFCVLIHKETTDFVKTELKEVEKKNNKLTKRKNRKFILCDFTLTLFFFTANVADVEWLWLSVLCNDAKIQLKSIDAWMTELSTFVFEYLFTSYKYFWIICTQ